MEREIFLLLSVAKLCDYIRDKCTEVLNVVRVKELSLLTPSCAFFFHYNH